MSDGIEFDVSEEGVIIFDMDDHCCIRLTNDDMGAIISELGAQWLIKHQKARGRIAE